MMVTEQWLLAMRSTLTPNVPVHLLSPMTELPPTESLYANNQDNQILVSTAILWSLDYGMMIMLNASLLTLSWHFWAFLQLATSHDSYLHDIPQSADHESIFALHKLALLSLYMIRYMSWIFLCKMFSLFLRSLWFFWADSFLFSRTYLKVMKKNDIKSLQWFNLISNNGSWWF